MQPLNFELDEMQTRRCAYFSRIRAKSHRLEKMNGVEPSNVDKTLDQLVHENLSSSDFASLGRPVGILDGFP
jgi:hypothetical protein